MQTLSLLATATAEHGKTFLGEDAIGWRIALIAAFVAAVAYELTMALTRNITLRIPFLMLQLGRLLMDKEAWKLQYGEWKAELWVILREGHKLWPLRFIHGMWWAASVLVYARKAAKADTRTMQPKPARVKEPGRISNVIALTVMIVSLADSIRRAFGGPTEVPEPLAGVMLFGSIALAVVSSEWLIRRRRQRRQRHS
ncbi:hypothetical protein [Streptomyces sp. EKR5.2]|uniref:hypothetical protein n=1 Tax=Streptomyces sp. EKR5.2 TaxID=3461014 RepID=UPI004041967B